MIIEIGGVEYKISSIKNKKLVFFLDDVLPGIDREEEYITSDYTYTMEFPSEEFKYYIGSEE